MKTKYIEKYKITKETISEFAKFSGDYNPIHMDDEYAANTRFGSRIAHGAILEVYISKILATDFPGPGTIYISQFCKWIKPVYIDDEVEICIEIVDFGEKERCILKTNCFVDGREVMKGEAVVKLPKDYDRN